MNAIKWFLIAGILIRTLNASAQQETYLTHAVFNRVLTNPAFAGNNSMYELSMVHHRQWLGLQDFTGKYRTEGGLPVNEQFPVRIAPVTSAFSFSAPIALCRNGEKSELGGIGFSAIQDVVGYENNTHFKAGFAGAIRLGQWSYLRVGVEFNYLTKRINTALLRAHQNPDPLIPSGTNPGDSRFIPGGGVVYRHDGKYQFFSGFSINGLTKPEFRYFNSVGAPVYIRAATHIQWMTGATLNLPGIAQWKAMPVLVVRSVSDGAGWVMPQADLQCNFEYNNRFSAGAGTRIHKSGMDALSFMLGFYPSGFQFNGTGRLRLGYAFDLTTQSLKSNSRNTHEIQLNYRFGRNCILPRRIRHPRDLEFNDKDQIKIRPGSVIYQNRG